MITQGVFPLKEGNHLLCGLTTVGYIDIKIGELWATKMIGGQTVKDAWFAAGRKSMEGTTNIVNNVYFRVAGWEDCMNDKLKSYSPTTSGEIGYEDSLVFP